MFLIFMAVNASTLVATTSQTEPSLLDAHDHLLQTFTSGLSGVKKVTLLGEDPYKHPDYFMPEDFFNGISQDDWHGLGGCANSGASDASPPQNFQELLDILKQKQANYLAGRRDNSQNKASHVVCIKNGLVFKFLNLMKPENPQVSDEEPQTEMICAAFYHALGIPELIAQTALVEIEGAGVVQISKAIDGKNLDETLPVDSLDSEAAGKQYFMSLFLGLGDAKGDNFKLNGKTPVAIDTEMAFRRPVRYCEERGAIPGNYSVLFKKLGNQKVDGKVKGWILSLDHKSDSEELKGLFYLCFGNLSNTLQRPNLYEARSTLMNRVYQNIYAYRARYPQYLDSFFTSQEGRKKLFRNLLCFYNSFRAVFKELANEEQDLSYGKLLQNYHEELKKYLSETEESEEDVIYKSKNTGLKVVRTGSFIFNLYRSFVEATDQQTIDDIAMFFPRSPFAQTLKGIHLELKQQNKKEAFSCYESALELDQNDPELNCLLAYCFRYKMGCDSNIEREKECWKKAADAGLDIGQHRYAQFLRREKKPEYEKYIKLAADQGFHTSQIEWANILLQKAKDSNDPTIWHKTHYPNCTETDEGVVRSEMQRKAVHYLIMAWHQDRWLASFDLGQCLEKGICVPDILKALKIKVDEILKELKIKEKSTDAQVAAVYLYLKAARDYRSAHRIAEAHNPGLQAKSLPSIRQRPSKAIKAYRRAEKRGFYSSEINWALSQLYDYCESTYAKGKAQNKEMANLTRKKAATLGHPKAQNERMKSLAVPISTQELSHIESYAKGGNFLAQKMMAVVYGYGLFGETKNSMKAQDFEGRWLQNPTANTRRRVVTTESGQISLIESANGSISQKFQELCQLTLMRGYSRQSSLPPVALSALERWATTFHNPIAHAFFSLCHKFYNIGNKEDVSDDLVGCLQSLETNGIHLQAQNFLAPQTISAINCHDQESNLENLRIYASKSDGHPFVQHYNPVVQARLIEYFYQNQDDRSLFYFWRLFSTNLCKQQREPERVAAIIQVFTHGVDGNNSNSIAMACHDYLDFMESGGNTRAVIQRPQPQFQGYSRGRASANAGYGSRGRGALPAYGGGYRW